MRGLVFVLSMGVCLTAVAAKPNPAGYPTAARVEFVLECMRDHQGGEYELLNKCSCVIDRLSEKYGYDDFVEAQTMAKGVTIAGERGGALRDNEQAQKEARAYRGAYKQAAEQCFLR
jgi:hypothetical protein